MIDSTQKIFCPNCYHTLTGGDYFCPFCGKQIKDKPVSLGVWKQISVYLVSALLPPMGLWPAVKYLRVADPKAKKVGLIALLITIISIIVSTWLIVGFVNTFNAELSKQMNGSMNFLGN